MQQYKSSYVLFFINNQCTINIITMGKTTEYLTALHNVIYIYCHIFVAKKKS